MRADIIVFDLFSVIAAKNREKISQHDNIQARTHDVGVDICR